VGGVNLSTVIKRVLIGFAIIISLVTLIYGFRLIQVVRTEENYKNILKGIMQIEFTNKNVIEINDYSYITKSDMKDMKTFLKKSGWEFEEQLGAGYSFVNSKGERLLLISRYVFSNRYLILESNNREM
jgi:hypothetical protein